MRLTSIEFENFRCFEKEKIDLHPQLNVFVGLNASGKTALLEGVAILLGEYIEKITNEGLKGPLMLWSDLKQESYGGVEIGCTATFDAENETASWSSSVKSMPLPGLTIELGTFVKKHPFKPYPVLLYFSTQRVWDRSKHGEPGRSGALSVLPLLKGYFEALHKKSNTSFFQAELEKEQKAAQQSIELKYEYDSSRLNLIRNLAAKVIENCEIFYYDYEKEGLAVMFKDRRRLTLDELSDGQKSLLLISTGIAFQCATLNPHMGLDAYKSAGVVLIDEVELHLHPDWQRQILPILTREFPNIQFICTTHSPQVLSTLKPENVHVIKDFKVTPLKIHTEGRDSNTILTEIFGIEKRPKEFEDKLQHFYSLLEKEAVEEAKVVFDDLESHWGTMDTEIVRARYFLEDLMDDLARAKEAAK
jgi:predicted ATP-binding protein involved in virulence